MKRKLIFLAAAAALATASMPPSQAADASSERTTMPDFCSNRDVTCLLPGGGGAVAAVHRCCRRVRDYWHDGSRGYDDDRHDRDHGYNRHDDGLHGRHHAAGQLDEWHRRLAHARKRIDPVEDSYTGQIQPAQCCHGSYRDQRGADGHERSAHGDRRSAYRYQRHPDRNERERLVGHDERHGAPARRPAARVARPVRAAAQPAGSAAATRLAEPAAGDSADAGGARGRRIERALSASRAVSLVGRHARRLAREALELHDVVARTMSASAACSHSAREAAPDRGCARRGSFPSTDRTVRSACSAGASSCHATHVKYSSTDLANRAPQAALAKARDAAVSPRRRTALRLGTNGVAVIYIARERPIAQYAARRRAL